MEEIKILSDCGADIFVAGTSAVFTKDFSVLEGIQKLRAAIE